MIDFHFRCNNDDNGPAIPYGTRRVPPGPTRTSSRYFSSWCQENSMWVSHLFSIHSFTFYGLFLGLLAVIHFEYHEFRSERRLIVKITTRGCDSGKPRPKRCWLQWKPSRSSGFAKPLRCGFRFSTFFFEVPSILSFSWVEVFFYLLFLFVLLFFWQFQPCSFCLLSWHLTSQGFVLDFQFLQVLSF